MELKEYFDIIKKRLWIPVATTFVFAVISAVISFCFLTPIYQADTTLYVGKQKTITSSNNANNAINYNDLMLGNQLAKDYRELIKSRQISEKVAQELHLDHIKPAQIGAMTNVTLKTDTRVIQIVVQNKDPKMAQEVADTTAQVFKDRVPELMQVENVKIIDVAEAPTHPVKPKKTMNIAIGTFLGLMLGLGIIFLIEFFDNTIKTFEDIQKHVDLPVLGSVQEFSDQVRF